MKKILRFKLSLLVVLKEKTIFTFSFFIIIINKITNNKKF
jgi:hypothetical protein